MEGWIKLYRKSLESAVFQNSNLWQVWCYCLMRANHKEVKILWNKKEETLKEGTFIVGRLEGAKQCKMKPTTFYLQLKTLQKLENIKIESFNKFSIVSVVNWRIYQNYDNKNTDYNLINKGLNEGDTGFNDSRMTTNRQQNDTDKNDKNEKNEKIYTLFSHWNSKNIIKHRKIDSTIEMKIKTALKNYSIEEIITAIDNYHFILCGDEYYFSYKWTLKDFLQKGLEKFLDKETTIQNYKKNDVRNQNINTAPQFKLNLIGQRNE